MPPLRGVRAGGHRDSQQLLHVALFPVQHLTQQFHIAVGEGREAEVQVPQVSVLCQQLKEHVVIAQEGHIIYPAEQRDHQFPSSPTVSSYVPQ